MVLQEETSGVQVDLKRELPSLPDEPGVYMFKDKGGAVLYVGKAKSLKKRVSSYFGKRPITSKILNMMNRARYLEFIVTSNEKEALLLESNLIKRFRPRYNVILRDDKRYPCLRINLEEAYPRFVIARRIERDGSIYFGPFHSAASMRSTLRLINKIFKLRSCKKLPKDKRPCLNYQIGRCLAPCTGCVSEKEYMDMVQNAIMFLKGKGKELIQKLTNDMLEASDKLEFERAARIRDQITAIRKVLEKQHMISPIPEDMDVIGIANGDGIFQLVVFMIREGYMIGSRNFVFKEKDITGSEILEAFLKQYYPDLKDLPDEIIVPYEIEDIELISSIISETSGSKIKIESPTEPRKRELVKMAIRNAEQLLDSNLRRGSMAGELKKLLHLKRLPIRIEAMDISQIRGKQRVGSVVAFLDGKPDKNRYRNFRIKGEYIDDYSMIAEVVQRRIKRGDLPDLFIIDGGKAHLAAAKKAIKRARLRDAPDIIAIAKSDNGPDRIYIEGRKDPLGLSANHPVLLFIMKIRDEVHRRAVTYHRKLRSKEEIGSLLNRIPGIGPKKMNKLLNKFKDINEIMETSIEDIARVPGIGPGLAERIKAFLMQSHC